MSENRENFYFESGREDERAESRLNKSSKYPSENSPVLEFFWIYF